MYVDTDFLMFIENKHFVPGKLVFYIVWNLMAGWKVGKDILKSNGHALENNLH